MARYDDIIANIPISDLARRLGVDEATARRAVDEALPALLGGMGANAQDPAGAASLEHAVQQHPPQLFEGGVDLDEVDEGDGDRIVHNVFGSNTDQVVQKLGSSGGADQGLIQKLLPILAPIVLSFLAGQFAKRRQESGTAGAEPSGGGGIGDILGGLLGGGGGGGGGMLGGLGDLLGGLLGAGKR
ncbi:DUF937 domain-containing protein [Agromyces arachidis]|uniref:DUF937 domain-containing protein n=1 Tax=Agromyces arachidis TaxID=766966 RepID=UPI00405690C2